MAKKILKKDWQNGTTHMNRMVIQKLQGQVY